MCTSWRRGFQAEGTASIKALEVIAYLMSCGNSKEAMSAERYQGIDYIGFVGHIKNFVLRLKLGVLEGFEPEE